MTKWEALIACRNHWQWLWITGDRDKWSYEPAENWVSGCACCEYVEEANIKCTDCPLAGYAWRKNDLTPCMLDRSSLYYKWGDMAYFLTDKIALSKYYAAQMVNACNRAIEDMLLK